MLSRVYCTGFHRNKLYEVHDALCHPGVTRLYHFVRSKNLPYSMNDVKKLVESCRVCSAVNLSFIDRLLLSLSKRLNLLNTSVLTLRAHCHLIHHSVIF